MSRAAVKFRKSWVVITTWPSIPYSDFYERTKIRTFSTNLIYGYEHRLRRSTHCPTFADVCNTTPHSQNTPRPTRSPNHRSQFLRRLLWCNQTHRLRTGTAERGTRRLFRLASTCNSNGRIPFWKGDYDSELSRFHNKFIPHGQVQRTTET